MSYLSSANDIDCVVINNSNPGAPPTLKPVSLTEKCAKIKKIAVMWLEMLRFYALEYPIEEEVCFNKVYNSMCVSKGRFLMNFLVLE